MSGDSRHEHGSGVRPIGEVPGARATNPAGLSRGVAVVYDNPIVNASYQTPVEPEPEPEPEPQPPAAEPRRRGRPPGSKNRPKDVTDAEPQPH